MTHPIIQFTDIDSFLQDTQGARIYASRFDLKVSSNPEMGLATWRDVTRLSAIVSNDHIAHATIPHNITYSTMRGDIFDPREKPTAEMRQKVAERHEEIISWIRKDGRIVIENGILSGDDKMQVLYAPFPVKEPERE